MEVVGGVVVKVEGFVIDQSGCYRVRLPGSRIMDEGSGFIIVREGIGTDVSIVHIKSLFM